MEELVITVSYYVLNINKSFSFLSIALDSYILLVRYSGFLLRASTLVFLVSLTYEIRKLYVASVSAQRTCRRLSSFIMVK
jgi:hypothetical protein